MSLLNALLARATSVPGLELYRGLAPRRFFVEHLLADIIRATEVLPISKKDGTFAVLTTATCGLPESLPEGWTEIANRNSYFAVYQTPQGTTSRVASEALALAQVEIFFPRATYVDQLCDWLQKELGSDPDPSATSSGPAPGPDPLGPVRIIDIPAPGNYDREPLSEEEEDRNFVYGSQFAPPAAHRYDRNCAGVRPGLAPDQYGPPEVSDVAIQEAEEAAFYFG